MRYIFILLISILFYCNINAQVNNIKISGLKISDNPMVMIDPNTGKVNDSLPKLYNITFFTNNISNARFLKIRIGTSQQTSAYQIDTVALFINENGDIKLKLGREVGLISSLKNDSEVDMGDMDNYLISVPISLSNVIALLWKELEISIIDSDNNTSETIKLTRD